MTLKEMSQRANDTKRSMDHGLGKFAALCGLAAMVLDYLLLHYGSLFALGAVFVAVGVLMIPAPVPLAPLPPLERQNR